MQRNLSFQGTGKSLFRRSKNRLGMVHIPCPYMWSIVLRRSVYCCRKCTACKLYPSRQSSLWKCIDSWHKRSNFCIQCPRYLCTAIRLSASASRMSMACKSPVCTAGPAANIFDFAGMFGGQTRSQCKFVIEYHSDLCENTFCI